MTPIKVYLDEDVHPFIAESLRLLGWEARTTVEAGRRETEDIDQIHYAAEHGFAILSYNVRDFPRLHYEFDEADDEHCGILVATQDDPRRTLRALLEIVANFSAEDLENQLLYVNNWDPGMD